MFIPESLLKKEAEHFAGFTPKLHGSPGNSQLAERLAISDIRNRHVRELCKMDKVMERPAFTVKSVELCCKVGIQARKAIPKNTEFCGRKGIQRMLQKKMQRKK